MIKEGPRREWNASPTSRSVKAVASRSVNGVDIGSVIIYRGGEFVKYDDAKVGMLTHGLNYGTGCFEGIRGYWNEAQGQLHFFRLAEHYERFTSSAKLLMIDLGESVADMCAHTTELVRRNSYRVNVYVRPLAFKGAEEVGVRLHNVTSDFSITVTPSKAYFDPNAGLRACVSSWRRVDDNAAPARAKLTGIYVNSALAKSEAIKNGFDEAILLNGNGYVAEGSAQNIFIVRDGVVITPPVSDGILEGITRRSLLEVCRTELHLETVERSIGRSELYVADEVFLAGTAVEVVGITSVDHRQVGDGATGKITSALGSLYRSIVVGDVSRYHHWLTPSYPISSANLKAVQKAAAS